MAYESGGGDVGGARRRSRSLSAPPRDTLEVGAAGGVEQGLAGRTQAPAGYFYDAAGDLRKIKAWYDGGSPRGIADVGWQRSPARRPQQAATAAAGARLFDGQSSSQDLDLGAERGSEDERGAKADWDATGLQSGRGWKSRSLDVGREVHQAGCSSGSSCSRIRSGSPAVLWRTQLVASSAAAPGSSRRQQQLEEEQQLRCEGMEQLLRHQRSSELLVRQVPRSVAAVASPRVVSGAEKVQLRASSEQLNDADEALYSVGLWRWVGRPTPADT
jgi:hypothetical protein